MRSELLALELAGYKSKLHAFTKSLIPATSNHLDKLIDNSSSPLPESFLDEQDRLEADASSLSTGLAEFLSQMVAQWRGADHVFWAARGVEVDAKTLVREAEEEIPKVPVRETADIFEQRAAGLRKQLDEVQQLLKRRSNGFLPEPRHVQISDQEEESAQLVKALQKRVLQAELAWSAAQAMAVKFRFAAEVMERARIVQEEMESALTLLRPAGEDLARIATERETSLQSLRCLEIPYSESETSSDRQWESIEVKISPVVSNVRQLLTRVSAVVGDLHKASVDPNVRRSVKETIEGLKSARDTVEVALGEGRRWTEVLSDLRKGNSALGDSEKVLHRTLQTVCQVLRSWRWVEESPPENREADIDVLLKEARESVLSTTQVVSKGKSGLRRQKHSTLLDFLDEQSHRLRLSLENLSRLQDLFVNVKAQTQATDELLTDVSRLAEETMLAVEELNHSITLKSLSAWVDGEIESTVESFKSRTNDIACRFEALKMTATTAIPFLAGASSKGTSFAPSGGGLPFGIEEQDLKVREIINEVVAQCGGKLDELRCQVEKLGHLGECKTWDQALFEATAEITRLEETVRTVAQNIETRHDSLERGFLPTIHDNSTRTRTDFQCTSLLDENNRLLQSAQASLEQVQALSNHGLKSLSLSLETLHTSPHSETAPFNSHPTRDSALSSLKIRIVEATTSTFALISSIAEAEEERKRKEASLAELRSEVGILEGESRELIRQLSDDLRQLSELEGRPRIADKGCLEVAPSELHFDLAETALSTQIHQRLMGIAPLIERIAIARQSDVDVSFKDRLDIKIQQLDTLRVSVEQALEMFEAEKRNVNIARELHHALTSSEARVENLRNVLSKNRKYACWNSGELTASIDAGSASTEVLINEVELIIGPRLNSAKHLMVDPHPKLAAYFNSRLSAMRSSLVHVIEVEVDVTRLLQHRSSVESFLDELLLLDEAVLSLKVDLAAALRSDFDPAVQANLESRTNAITSHLTEMPSRVPPFGDRIIPSSCHLPYSLSSIDPSLTETSISVSSDLQEHVLAVEASIAAAFETTREHESQVALRFASLAHLAEATAWDQERSSIDVRLSAANQTIKNLIQDDGAFYSSSSFVPFPSSLHQPVKLAHRSSLLTTPPSIEADVSDLGGTLEALASSLTTLQAAPESLLDPFNKHMERQVRLRDLRAHYVALVDALSILSSSIESANASPARQLEETRLAKESAKRMADELVDEQSKWCIRLSALSTRFQQMQSSQIERLEQVKAANNAFERWRSTAAVEDQALLQLEKKNRALSSDVNDRMRSHGEASAELDRLTVEAVRFRLEGDLFPTKLLGTSVGDQLKEAQERVFELVERLRLAKEDSREREELSQEQEGKSNEDEEEKLRVASSAPLAMVQKGRGAGLDKARLAYQSEPFVSSTPLAEFAEGGIRRPQRKGRISLTSKKDLEDIFGPTLHSTPFSDIPDGDDDFNQSLSLLEGQLREITVERWLDDRTFLQLPTKDDVEKLKRQLSLVGAQLEDLESDNQQLEFGTVKVELERKINTLVFLEELAMFGETIASADVALSDLLTSIDASTPGLEFPPSSSRSPTPEVRVFSVGDALLSASNAVSRVRIQAIPLLDDSRVNFHIGRIEEALAEMSGMVDDLKPRSKSQSSSRSSSVASSSSHSSRRPYSLTLQKATSRENSRRPSHSSMDSRVAPPSHTPERHNFRPPPPPSPSHSTPRARVRSAVTLPRSFNFSTATKNSLSKSTSTLLPPLAKPPARRASPLLGKQRVESRETESFFNSLGRSTLGRSTRRRDSLASSTSSTISPSSSALPSPALNRRYSSVDGSPRAQSFYSRRLTPPRQKTVYKPNVKRKVDVEVGGLHSFFSSSPDHWLKCLQSKVAS